MSESTSYKPASVPVPIASILRNHQLWLVVGMLVFAIIAHYAYLLPGFRLIEGLPFDHSSRSAARVFFLLPMAYAGFAFGRLGAAWVGLLSVLIMLPGVLMSSAPWDAAMEVGAVILVGGLISMWFEAQERDRMNRQNAMDRLEVAQQQYQSLVQALRENQKNLAALNSISQITTQSLELSNILNNALDRVLEVMALDVGWIYLLDQRDKTLELAATRGLTPRVAGAIQHIRLAEGFDGTVADKGEPLLVEDATKDPYLARSALREERLRTLLVVPVQSKGWVLGTLGVASRGARRLGGTEVDMLTAIGNQIGVAVENARLYEEQRAIADQLRASEDSCRSLFENANDAIFLRDESDHLIGANQAAAELAGRSRSELVSAPMSALFPKESIAAMAETQARLLAGEAVSQPLELTLLRPDGKEVPIEATTSLLNNREQPVTFQYIARDVTQQRQLQETMRFYARQVTKAQEDERKRIARELHDETAQALVALSRRIDDTMWNDGDLSRETTERLESIRVMADTILDGVRRFSRDLRPSILDDLGLMPALDWLTTDLTRQSGIQAELKVVNEPRRLPPETELVLFRIIQEALSNVRKHANASQVEVVVEFDEGQVKVRIRDNGRGFDPQKVVMGDLVSTGKLGLIGMNERAQLLGGKATVESQPGQGTTVTVEVEA